MKTCLINVFILVIQWNIQCYTSLGISAVLQITRKANERIQRDDTKHANIQYPRTSNESLRILHFILQRHNDADSLQRKDHIPEEHRPLRYVLKKRSLGDRRHVQEHETQRDHDAGQHEDVGDQRKRSQKLEDANAVDDQQRNQQHANVQPNVDVSVVIVIDDLLDIRCNEHIVDTAGTDQIQHEEQIDEESSGFCILTHCLRSSFEGDFANLAETQRRDFGSKAEQVRAGDQNVDTIRADNSDHNGGY